MPENPLSHPCPFCCAKRGKPCVSMSPHNRGVTLSPPSHAQRRFLAGWPMGDDSGKTGTAGTYGKAAA